MTARNLLVVQGGGPTQVLNATLAAVVEEARTSGRFGRIFGARRGLLGFAGGDAVDLDLLSSSQLAALRLTPGAALGTSRVKLAPDDLTRLLTLLGRLDIHDLLLCGGNGTMSGAVAVASSCRTAGYEARVLGIPKTVDNDIAQTDRCPGYSSAARYIAQAARDLGSDVRSLPQPVSILETMGRSVGWLAAAATAGKRSEDDAPHLVCIPERAFVLDEFLSNLDRILARQGWAVVAVAEGIRNADGSFVYQSADPTQADPLKRPICGGVAQFLAETVAARLRVRCRSEKPGLLGRASQFHTAPQDRADAELVGRAAVRGLLANSTGQMVALLPLSAAKQTGIPAESGCTFVPLSEVAEIERPIPAAWTQAGPIPVNTSFFEYLQPLIGALNDACEPLPLAVNLFGKE